MNSNVLAKKCVKKLKKYELVVATAESLTGGMIAKEIVDIPGASNVFEEGFVTYSNYAKAKNLLVDPVVIAENGVVSKEVASQMAKGVLKVADSDIALATTGVAGPDSDEFGTKVGTVYIACATRERVFVREYHFKGNRDKIRRQATDSAFKLLLDVLKR